jgi:hypothetical protein
MAWVAKVTIGEQEEKASVHSMDGCASGVFKYGLQRHSSLVLAGVRTGEAKAKQHGCGDGRKPPDRSKKVHSLETVIRNAPTRGSLGMHPRVTHSELNWK